MTTFSDLPLSPQLINNLTKLGITTPTSIQIKAIPALLEHDADFVGQAQTGTGKTAAFALPLIQRLDFSLKKPQALILTPTRELAKQIGQEIARFAGNLPVKTVLIYGGASYAEQISALRKRDVQIVIGTPGRIIDLMERGVLHFDESEFVVLDEADEMLQMGFQEAVDQIIDSFGPQRKIWMFSATMPKGIANMIDRKFNNPITIKAEKSATSNALVQQHYIVVESKKKIDAMVRLMQFEQIQSAMVFCKMRAQTVEVVEKLVAKGVKAEALNGDMSQGQREIVMGRFKNGKLNVLVCTDVAARGIDVQGLSHVFNFNLPMDVDSYTHRIGRTGRAGNEGRAYNMVLPSEQGLIRRIENVTKSKMIKGQIPTPQDIKLALVSRELEKMSAMLQVAQEKKDSFKTDTSFDSWREFFKQSDKEEILRVLFNRTFNRDFRLLDEAGDLNLRTPLAQTAHAPRRENRWGDGGYRGERRPFNKRRPSYGR